MNEMKINHYQGPQQCQASGFQADDSQYSNVSLEEKDQVVISKTNNKISRIYDKQILLLILWATKNEAERSSIF